MAARFWCVLEEIVNGVSTIRVGFGEPATNDLIVRDAIQAIADLQLTGGKGIRFNGPISVPAAMALAHAVAHQFGFVAMFDPKIGKYIVAISHDPAVKPGDLME